MEHEEEETFSPKQTPRARKNTMVGDRDIEMLNQLNDSDSNTSSFMRRRLIGGVRYNKNGKKQ